MRLRPDRLGSRPCEGAGQLGKDCQVSVQPHAVDAPDAQRRERPVVLEAAKLALDGSALSSCG